MRAEEMTNGQLAAWYFGMADRWPDVFRFSELSDYWGYARAVRWKGANDCDRAEIALLLRAAALKMLHRAVKGCSECPLSQHRLPGRPVLDDGSFIDDPFVDLDGYRCPVGANSAQIMVVGEGPGQFEQRAGVPFVSSLVLRGSVCLWECGEYDKCYNSKSPFPQQPCKPTSLRKTHEEGELLQIRTERANAPNFRIQTVAGYLDEALQKAGLWRQVWNGRQSLRESVSEANQPKPGSVYVTNVVKCRSCKPKDGGGFEDATPAKAYVEACSPWLLMQVYIIQPRVVVALGNSAIEGVVDVKEPKVTTMRGNIYPSKFGLPALADFHPSFIARQPADPQKEYLEHLTATFERAKAVAAGTVSLPWLETETVPLELDAEVPSPAEMQTIPTFEDTSLMPPGMGESDE